MEKTNRALTDKERRFIEEYTGGICKFNRRQSAIAAGYSERSAHEIGSALMDKPHIQDAIEARMNEMSERCAVNVETITKQLYDTYELAMCGMVDREGKPPGMATASAAAAVTALMSIAKLHGLVVDKKELTGKDGAPLVPGKMLVELVDPTDLKGSDTP